jgi:hypothetical protein
MGLVLAVVIAQVWVQASTARAAPPASPNVRLIAQAEGTSAVGQEMSNMPGAASNPLQVPAGRRVTLTSQVEPSSLRGKTQLVYGWRQLGGPAVEWLTQPGGRPSTSFVSRVQWRAKNPGVYQFECRVSLLDSNGVPTGVEISKHIMIRIVQSPR